MPDKSPETKRVLILGGTQDAAAIARAFADDPAIHTISSLAGRTRAPRALAGEVRSGGFGGADGLAQYLEDAQIDAVIDATHPFAVAISRHAAEACERAGVPRVQLQRPPWTVQDGDRWIEVDDVDAAARVLPQHGRRAFLTIGRQEIPAFASVRDVWFLVRLIDPPAEPIALASFELISQRGPFEAAAEAALMRAQAIEVLVSKNSGGTATYGKIEAARRLSVPVVMIRQPPRQPGDHAADAEEACAWLRERFAAG
ncbi:MAG: cobalt-precorrin-6A reductase [Alphaproteobacteria bacterium]